MPDARTRINRSFRERVHGVLLAGGMQTRLAGHGIHLPKAMIEIGGREVGHVALMELARVSARVSIVAGTRGDAFSLAWRPVGAAVITDPVLGTGVAVHAAATASPLPVLCIANADTLNGFRFDGLVASYFDEPDRGLIALTRSTRVQNPGAFAVDADGIVLRSFEDGQPGVPPWPGSAWHGASTGVVLLPRTLMTKAIGNGWQAFASLERDVLPWLVRRRLLRAYDCGPVISLDFGTVERIDEAHALLRQMGRSFPR